MRLFAGLLVAAFLALVPAAHARDLTPDESAALTRTIEDFNAAMERRDMATITQAIPPRVIKFIADGAGITVEQLTAAMAEQMQILMKDVTIEAFSMDFANAEKRELADGTPYFVIATETTVSVGSAKTTEYSPTLALMEDGKWYLVRIAEQAQIDLLYGAYPEFAGVEFPPARTEKITQ